MPSPARPAHQTARRSAPGGRRRASATRSAPTTGSSVTPSTWHCIVTAVPTAASTHQRRRPVVQAHHAPASAIELDRAMRFGFQMNVDSSTAEARDGHRQARDEAGDRPADRSGQPPRDEHGGDPGQRDEGRDRERRIAAGQERGRCEQVVVERAVVDVADRRRRAEQRDDPVADEGPEHEHVVALVGVPRAARRQVRQTQDRRDDQQADRDEGQPASCPAPCDGVVTPRRPAADRPVARCVPGCRRISIASGGSSASGRPAAMS